MGQIMVAQAYCSGQPPEGSRWNVAFLAIEEDQRTLWSGRLGTSPWSRFEFFRLNPEAVDAVVRRPPNFLELCAVTFAYGVLRTQNDPVQLRGSLPILEWDDAKRSFNLVSRDYDTLRSTIKDGECRDALINLANELREHGDTVGGFSGLT